MWTDLLGKMFENFFRDLVLLILGIAVVVLTIGVGIGYLIFR